MKYGSKNYNIGMEESPLATKKQFRQLAGLITELRNDLGTRGAFGGAKQKKAAIEIENLQKAFDKAFLAYITAYR